MPLPIRIKNSAVGYVLKSNAGTIEQLFEIFFDATIRLDSLSFVQKHLADGFESVLITGIQAHAKDRPVMSDAAAESVEFSQSIPRFFPFD